MMRGKNQFFPRAGQRKYHSRKGYKCRSHGRSSASWFELLERRALLTADIAIANFSADGTNLLVDYDISNSNVSAFDISIYRSSNGTSLDTLLQTQRMTASGDLQVGTGHRATIAPSFSDIDSDYFLVAVVDSSSEISESSESNNQMAFAGGAFLASNGLLHIHGTNSGEWITVSQGTSLDISVVGSNYSYTPSSVSGIRIRSHGGSDGVFASNPSKPQLICGGSGEDLLIAGSGNDIIHGGDDSDTIYAYGGDDYVYGEGGNDFIYGGANSSSLSYDALFGGDGDDYIYGGLADGSASGKDYIEGGSGADVIHGEDGDDYILSNDGNDTVYGADGNDTIYGGDNDDTLYGGAGNDWIYAGTGNDVLIAGTGNDAAYGEAGDDLLYIGSGGDAFVGGAGSDTYRFEPDVGDVNSDTLLEDANVDTDVLDFSLFTGAYAANMSLNLATTSAQIVVTNKAKITIMAESAFETVICGAGNDSVTGNSRANVIQGADGNDTIYGGTGNDSLLGGAGTDSLYGDSGNDALEGEAGNDTLNGGAGDDVYRFWGNSDLGSDTVAETASNGTDTLDFSSFSGGVGLHLENTGTAQSVSVNLSLTLSNANAIENVTGTAGDDYITGNDLNNVIDGLDGTDAIYGGDGDDVLSGGAGGDLLLGEDGTDIIYGGAGNDVLYADDGICECSSLADELYGNDGEDWLYGGGINNFLDGGSGIDHFDGSENIADRPYITVFDSEVVEGGLFRVYGHVEDDGNTEGLTVVFGGVLTGQTATVDENGNFEILFEDEQSAPDGEASAAVTDLEGLTSESATTII